MSESPDRPELIAMANPDTRWQRFCRRVPRLHLYQIPGYGSTYRAVNRWAHRRGLCLLRRGNLPHPDGGFVWRCSWCGNSVLKVDADREALLEALRDAVRGTGEGTA